MFNLSEMLKDSFLDDHVKEPIIINVENLSEKYNIKMTIQVKKKGD